jgi:transcriptional regulator with XRE-family HTH domain
MNVEKFRTAKGLTQEDLARETELTVGTVSRIERGENNPTLGTLEKIATALDVTVIQLLREPTDNRRFATKGEKS